ncbi:MAG: pectate lyase [Pseudomonadota bacterium]
MIRIVAIAGLALAAVIGQMTPAAPLNAARIAALPAAERAPWLAYLERSQALATADKAALAAERRGLAALPQDPAEGKSAGMPLRSDAAWYRGPEARHVADNILSFQTPAGGWSKNQDRSGPVRQRGQAWAYGGAIPEGGSWNYVGTIDNGATTTELRFLARIQRDYPGAEGDAYRAAFAKGVRYLLAAQYPNGGWPQVYPLQGGYHDAITFNDDALADVVTLLAEAGGREGDFAFVASALATEAAAAVDRAYKLILATQVVVDGKRTVWGQQHDMLTGAPTGARNFEPASLSSGESAGLLVLLMRRRDPSPETQAAIEAGVGWLRDHAVRDMAWESGADGRKLVARPGASVIWSRFYDLATMKPIFGDRDKTIHDDVNELSRERRNGYSWFNATPKKALDAYEKWPGRTR